VITPTVGDPAPDAGLLDGDGAAVRLSDGWTGHPAVVVFLRYFGCPFCQAQIVGLREDRERFERTGASVILVGQGTPAECREFCDRRHVPFAVLVDPERTAFRAYELPIGRPLQVAGPRVSVAWVRTVRDPETRQRGLRGGSFFQMPGTFVVDPGGIIRFAHRNRHVADTPRNQALLEAIEGLAPAAEGRRRPA
jgi:peroxiredoxin